MFSTQPSIDTNPIAFQLASMTDANTVAELAQLTYIETYGKVGNFKSDNVAKVKKIYGDTFINHVFPHLIQNHIVAIAKVNQQAVGFAILLFKENNTAFLDKLYFLKDHQGQKLGTQLLQFCFRQASNNGMTQGKLLVNKNARKKTTGFYEKFGFKKTGTQENLYTLDGTKTRTMNDVMTCDNFIKIFSPDPFQRNQGNRKRKSEALLIKQPMKKQRIESDLLPASIPTPTTLVKISFFGKPITQFNASDITSSSALTPKNQ